MNHLETSIQRALKCLAQTNIVARGKIADKARQTIDIIIQVWWLWCMSGCQSYQRFHFGHLAAAFWTRHRLPLFHFAHSPAYHALGVILVAANIGQARVDTHNLVTDSALLRAVTVCEENKGWVIEGVRVLPVHHRLRRHPLRCPCRHLRHGPCDHHMSSYCPVCSM